MLNMFKKIMPREERFFDMFDRHAACLLAGSQTLRALLDGGPQVPELCAKLMRQEQDADDICSEVLLAVRRTFITPFDRSDIKGLITAMDDAIDQMNKTAKTIVLFEVKHFEEPMRLMGDQILKAASLTNDAVPLLRAMRKNSNRLHDLTSEIARLEEESDHVHEAGVKKLYLDQGHKDPMAFIVGRELYSHLEKVADRFEDVARTVSGILIEHL